jgi:undecaprenyl-diphosphatase
MEFWLAILKGALQGLTEFLPVSSTAHLIFFEALAKLLGFETVSPNKTAEEFFDIMLHLGTLTAVLVYFRDDLKQVWQACFSSSGQNQAIAFNKAHWGRLIPKQLPILIISSTVVTVVWVLGLLKGTEVLFSSMGWATPEIENLSDFYLVYPQWVAIHLLITGTFLFFIEKKSETTKSETKNSDLSEQESNKPMQPRQALLIGWAQGMAAIFHGLSRSGSTISAGLLSGLDRVTATRYSFLLSIPTFLMAAVYESLKLWKAGGAEDLNWPAMIAGTVVSGVVGYWCVKAFIQFVGNHKLTIFSYYCWTVGILMLVIL